MYIIKDTNERYYMNWVGNTPVFNGDISSAKILNETDANKVIKSMKNINKSAYEKVLCDDNALMKSAERNNPEWYRQQIVFLLSKYKKKSEDIYEDESYSICDQIVDDLEKILD
ncbi:hypothetical protein [Lacrimispora algidixylanolytica]|uniref:Uncharacterized protein n=1 Tax=Lacrimispora algidixylanolytica TaxID=94868 RepID=A0A419SS75_9FIRM|nr:hypothetical protein [Lacrimispora algidixylanolytica]RKD28080.1 hypothetical protein BET01_11075 [Lacrimispora algidixylanolytica]